MTKYLLKCDISGIQKFIFNVPSNGAAKALKSRSEYVQTIAKECLEELETYFSGENPRELYNGGGNFYLEVKTAKSETDIKKRLKTIDDKYLIKDIFPYISFVERKSEKIGEDINAVNKVVQRAKMQRPVSFDLTDARPIKVNDIDLDELRKNNNINGQVPDGDFEEVAKKSEGAKKLAGLKLDVDNLGSLFRERDENDYQTLSSKLKKFFDADLLSLIQHLKMEQNVYCVFSGGDDCFLIGSWNKIFELAIELRKKFASFQAELRKRIKDIENDLTFSAGIVVFAPHSPVLQLAEEVEDELSTSKCADGKNSVTVFGKTLSWNDFEKAQSLATQLANMCNNDNPKKKEGKSLLQIFRSITPQKNEMPKVWRLKYYLNRNIKSDNFQTVQQIFKDFETALLLNYYNNKSQNADIYLVASRWAELLMKDKT
jgi:CRISPR-associated protein Csm1